MKKLNLFFYVFLLSVGAFAQTGIGTTSPDASAQLEVSSTTKGFLAPRMTEVQRLAISNPATGLLVYQSNTSDYAAGFYYYNGSVWVRIGEAGAASQWISSADSIYFTSGNVGIGGSSFPAKLNVAAAVSDKHGGFRMNLSGNSGWSWGTEVYTPELAAVGNNVINLAGVSGTAKNAAYWGFKYNGDASDANALILGLHSVDNAFAITGAGKVGIGTTAPAYKLDVNGSINATQMLVNGIPVGTSTSSYWNETGSDIYYNIGKVGIGTTTPVTALSVNGTLSMLGNSTSYIGNSTASGRKILEIRAGVSNATGAGINMYGSDDPTNPHAILFYTGGSEQMRISSSGNIGIGTINPASSLDVQPSSGDAIQWRNSGGSVMGVLGRDGSPDAGWLTLFKADGETYGLKLKATGNSYLNGGNVGIGTTVPYSRLSLGNSPGNISQRIALYEESNGHYFYGIGLCVPASSASGIGLFGGTEDNVPTDESPHMFIQRNTGNVGIGTTSPLAKLHLTAASKAAALKIDGDAFLEFGAGFTKESSAGKIGYQLFTADALDIVGAGTWTGDRKIKFWAEGGTHFTGTISVFNGATCDGTSWINASDRRLKRDIQPMSAYGLKEVMKLQPVSYYFKSDETNRKEIGFIAQDVQQIIPEVVSGTEGDIEKGETLGIAYGNLVPVLTKAIQEQQVQIEKQQTRISELEKKIEVLTRLFDTALNK